MSKNLVAYFSASGVTKKVAERVAKAVNGDIFEIKPEIPYTEADLDWQDPNSRSSVEMVKNPEFRPRVSGKVSNMDQYEVLFLGFPIWWYVAPTIVNTFLESYDFSSKKIVLFATSGGSGMGKTAESLALSAKGAEFVGEIRFKENVSQDEINQWIEKLKI